MGRAEELELLASLLRRDQAALVVGEAGIGKTSLIREAAELAGRIPIEITCLATLSGRPYAGLRRLLGGSVEGDAAYLATLVERRVGPDVLVVDDLQWLDAATRAVVAELSGRVTMVIAVRSGTAESEAAIELATRARSERIDLGPLPAGAAVDLVRRRAPGMSTADAERLVRRAGGNPFFVLELAAAGSPTAGSDVVIRRRLAELSEDALESARRLAVLGRPATPREAGEGSEALVRAGIGVSEGGLVAIRHQLLAEHVLAAIPRDAVARLSRELAALSVDPLEAARLYLAGGDRRAAAAAAAAAEASATAIGERIEALRLRAEASSDEDARALRLEAAARLSEVHDYARAAELLEGVAGWDDLSAVRLDALQARISLIAGSHPQASQLIARATPIARALVAAGRPGSGRVLADLLTTESQLLGWTGNPSGALDVAAEAVAIADTLPGAHRTRTTYGYLLVTADRLDEALDHLRRAAAEARAADDGPGELNALNVLLLAEFSALGWAPALATCELVMERATTLHLFGIRDALRSYHVFVLDAAGRYREAVEAASELAASVSARSRIYGPAFTAQALGRLGRFEAARAMLAEVEPLRGGDPEADRAYLDVAATIELAEGRPGAALQLLEASLAMSQKGASDLIDFQVQAMWARWEAGRDPGEVVDPGVAPRVAAVGPESEGLVALARGEDLRAAAAFERAASAWAPFYAWNADRCRWAQGEALRRAGRADDARLTLLEAEQVALARDARPQLARIQRSLRLLGLRRSAPRAAGGDQLLTAREREVVGLVAAGASNTEIARRLGLGRPTVQRLLGSAMGKLGAETRSQAVALAEVV